MTTLRTAPSDARVRSQPSTPIAALLAWLIPGLGHWYLGYRDRGVIIFVALVVTFWGGVALGGVRSTFNVQENGPWLAAQLCAGPQAIVGLMWGKSLKRPQALQGMIVDRNEASYPAADIAVVYTGVAGLLNLLVVIDALARSEAGGLVPAARPPPGGRGA